MFKLSQEQFEALKDMLADNDGRYELYLGEPAAIIPEDNMKELALDLLDNAYWSDDGLLDVQYVLINAYIRGWKDHLGKNNKIFILKDLEVPEEEENDE